MEIFVYHLPKISGLSRRARLDSSYNIKTGAKLKKIVNGKGISIRNVKIGRTGLPFQRLFTICKNFQGNPFGK